MKRSLLVFLGVGALGGYAYLCALTLNPAHAQAISQGGGGATVTIGTANGLSLAGTVLSMSAAGASTTGAITTGAQTIAGVKSFSSAITPTNSTVALDYSTIGGDANIKQAAGNDVIYNFGSTEFFRIKHGGGLDINTNGATVNIYGGGSMNNSSSGQPLTVSDAQGFALVGVANASLATCNNTAPPAGTRGTIQYDTTNSVVVFCNGTVWKTITTN